MTRRVTWTWTNWTFGIWWDRKRLHTGGIDIGPLEIAWSRSRRARFVVKADGLAAGKGVRMHKAEDCERCQMDLALYGESLINGQTGEHYDVPTMTVLRRRLVGEERHA